MGLFVSGAERARPTRRPTPAVAPALTTLSAGAPSFLRAPLPEAIRQTCQFAGRGILFTTIILVLGFLPLARSDYSTTWMMGTFIPLALVVALATDLLLVPAMATWGLFQFRER